MKRTSPILYRLIVSNRRFKPTIPLSTHSFRLYRRIFRQIFTSTDIPPSSRASFPSMRRGRLSNRGIPLRFIRSWFQAKILFPRRRASSSLHLFFNKLSMTMLVSQFKRDPRWLRNKRRMWDFSRWLRLWVRCIKQSIAFFKQQIITSSN